MWIMWDMVLDYLGDMLDLQRGVIIFIEDVYLIYLDDPCNYLKARGQSMIPELLTIEA